ncbi:MAG: hypothetical protein KatS3mg111_4257 [Pirellulaceae bacterium]|nr:MAG: hypothetical protein KatS3mg111_4257 [Pirellulaceae bacterium]
MVAYRTKRRLRAVWLALLAATAVPAGAQTDMASSPIAPYVEGRSQARWHQRSMDPDHGSSPLPGGNRRRAGLADLPPPPVEAPPDAVLQLPVIAPPDCYFPLDLPRQTTVTASRAQAVLGLPQPIPHLEPERTETTPASPSSCSPSLLALPATASVPSTAAPAPRRPPPVSFTPRDIRSGVATQLASNVRPGAGGNEPSQASPSDTLPFFIPPPQMPVASDQQASPVPYDARAFAPNPLHPCPSTPEQEIAVYRGKFEVPVQRPLIEWWRPLYASGILPPPRPFFGPTNLSKPHFYVYGDFRTGIGVNDARGDDRSIWAFRANLDMDLQLTATERLHAFIGPLDRGGDFTRLELGSHPRLVDRTDLRLDNLFFEGDLGQIWGGLQGTYAPFDLPFAVGFLPLFYQNGIWAADNVIGAAVSIPSRNSPRLLWSNYDVTFFWATDQVDSDAFPGDQQAAEFFGTAWFIDAYDGYIEADYAYVHDKAIGDRSYHNISVAFTRRYLQRLSNSVRIIANVGQSLPADQRTADGVLFLLENSLISHAPNTFVPYFNAFYGQGRPQSLARAAGAGGVLNNTGIHFETDGLTGYPTLDFTANNTAGAALGFNLLSADFRQQLVVEVAGLAAVGSPQFRAARGDQYAVGLRYQRALSNAWLFRTDHMVGWLRNDNDIRGSRIELRWKF